MTDTTMLVLVGLGVLAWLLALVLIPAWRRRRRALLSPGAGNQGTRHHACPGCTCGLPTNLGGIPVIYDQHVPPGKGYIISGDLAVDCFADVLRSEGWNARSAHVVVHPDDRDRMPPTATG